MTDSIQRIQDLIENTGFSAKKILSELEISSNALTEWKKGKAKPSTDAIIKLATYFNVTTDFLLLGTQNDTFLIRQDLEVLNLYHQLPDDEKKEFLGFIKGYLAKTQKIETKSISQKNA